MAAQLTIDQAIDGVIDFGTVAQGDSVSVPVTLRNTGDADINISAISLSGGDTLTFSDGNPSPVTMGPADALGADVNVDGSTPNAAFDGVMTIFSTELGSTAIDIIGVIEAAASSAAAEEPMPPATCFRRR